MSAAKSVEREDLFALPWDDGNYLLYAPLRRAAAVVNRTAALAAVRALSGESPRSAADHEVVRSLEEQGFLVGPTPGPPIAPPDYVFRPYEATLFPTSRCNLRCTYCYAEGGLPGPELSWTKAKAAIDFVAENAALAGRDAFAVAFHGGGEPTLAWDLVTDCVAHAEALAHQSGLKVHIYAASNGLLSGVQREFIAQHFAGLNISFDGPEDIQDRQRPRVDGSGSFAGVLETVRHFESLGFSYGVRATVTSDSVGDLSRLVSFFRAECPSLRQLHVEPVWCCGRCQTSGDRPPKDAEFASRFVEAWSLADAAGLRLVYSGARLDVITNRFCAAAGDGFSVTPTGAVTSCFEVVDAADPRASLFHYGHFDDSAGRFVFEEDKIARLRLLTVDHVEHCRDCFCKWHCAGDCLAKALHSSAGGEHKGSVRCQLNRALTVADLKRIVDRAQRRNDCPLSSKEDDQ